MSRRMAIPGSQPAISVRRELFASDWVRVGEVRANPASPEWNAWRESEHCELVLPLSGAFQTHFGTRHREMITISDGVVLPPNVSHRFSFVDSIGDHCLVLRWSTDGLRDLVPSRLREDRLAVDHRLLRMPLSAPAVMARQLLWHQLRQSSVDSLASDELCMELLSGTLGSARDNTLRPSARRMRRLELVRAAIAQEPQTRWSLASLAQLASMSPYHLAHEFRQAMGTPVYRYVLCSRLTRALDEIIDSEDDLTTVAHRNGFSGHSHFTTRFREMFGLTPSQLRRTATRSTATQLRKIVIAQDRLPH